MMDSVRKPQADDLTRALEEARMADAVRRVSFETLDASPESAQPAHDIHMVMDLPVQVSVELGRTRMSIGELLKLHPGSVVELDVSAGDPLDLVVNGCLVARGEVVIVNERYGIRLTDIVSPSERLRPTQR
jgi:flagellar motor switch protein FliN/FliY